ncbi:MAG TPA: hypothetical protein VHZ81_03155 [Galbitalea sp.]|nr:hypothetical protein [Galbitalea sp.]
MSEQTDGFAAMVQAQDRTTHAVRALARFLLIESVSAIIGGILFACAGAAVLAGPGLYWFLLVAAIIVLVGGMIGACAAAIEELRLSANPRLTVTSGLSGVPRPATPAAAQAARLAAPGPSLKPPTVDPDRRIFFSLSLEQRAVWHGAGEPALRDWDGEAEPFERWLERSH